MKKRRRKHDAAGQSGRGSDLSSREKKQGEYTISDYYAIPEDVRAELIDGVIYDMAPPLSVHQLLSAKIHGYLARYIEKKGGSCIPFFAPIGVQLDKDDKTIVEPDILIVCDRNQITRRGIYGAPDFVIEILSESTKEERLLPEINEVSKCRGTRVLAC